ncbi:MAG: glycosyltransferase [Lentisphaeria bacterium]|nr:glycosyltransferase [Lentisphaeria bacterium]
MGRNRNPIWYIACMTLLLAGTFSAAIFFYCRFAAASSVPTAATWIWRGLSVMLLSYVAYIVIRAFFYKTPCAVDSSKLPGCTVLVPVYNEGKGVMTSLESLLSCHYPPEKLEIIAINDGSEDDTLEWLQRTADAHPGRIKILSFEQNSGKKAALCAGTREAKYEYIITVDSDSVVAPESLQAIVAGFADPKVGAVAGNLRVLNIRDGIIPCMMDTAFLFVCEIIRTSQSLDSCVMCTPGALSGYRRSLMLQLMDRWQAQHFLGVPAKIGEDRALATMILTSGYKIVFARNALVKTIMPQDYPGMCKVLLRWTRSDIRENFLLLTWLIRQHRFSGRLAAMWYHNIIQTCNTLLPSLFLPSLLLVAFFASWPALKLCLTAALLLGLLMAAIPAMVYARQVSVLRSAWAFVFSAFNLFGLSWIPLYSFLTLRNTDWLTRKK